MGNLNRVALDLKEQASARKLAGDARWKAGQGAKGWPGNRRLCRPRTSCDAVSRPRPVSASAGRGRPHSLTSLHVHLEDLLLADYLGPAAALTAVLGVDALALALALDAHSLDLLHHARPDLLDVDLHPAALAQGALLHGPLLPTNTCRDRGEGPTLP